MINCPISIADVTAAEDIFGKDEGSLHGKTTRSKTHQVKVIYFNIPNHLVERYQSVTLSTEFFFNGIPFFVTISHHIKFVTYLMTKDQRIKPLVETVK